MNKVTILLTLLALALITHELMEVLVFLSLLFSLLTITVCLTRHIQRYLIKKRFEKEFKDVFTQDFYNRINKVIKNEFKLSNDKLCSNQA